MDMVTFRVKILGKSPWKWAGEGLYILQMITCQLYLKAMFNKKSFYKIHDLLKMSDDWNVMIKIKENQIVEEC